MVGVSPAVQNAASAAAGNQNGGAAAADTFATNTGNQYNSLIASNQKILGIWGSLIKKSDALKGQVGRINESFGRMAKVLGDSLAPTMKIAADFMSVLADKFVNLPGWAKQGVAILFLLVSGLFAVSAAVAMLLPGLTAISSGATAAAGALGLTNVALSSLVLPILAVIAAAALLYLAWKNNLFGIRDIAKKAFAAVKQLFNKFVGFVKPFWDKFLGDALAGRWKEALGTLIKFLAASVAKLVKIWYALRIRIVAAVAKLGARVVTAFETMVTKATNGVKRGINGIIAAFENGFNQALSGLDGFVSQFVGGINDVLTSLNKLEGVNLGTVSAVNVGSVSLGRLDTRSDAEIEQQAKKKLEARLSMIEQAKQQSLDGLDSIEQWFMSEFVNNGADSSTSSGGDTHNMTKVQLQPGAVQIQGTGDSETDMEYAAQKASKIIGEQVGSRGGVQ